MWKIYYGDGNTFSSNDGTHLDAPPWNVQIVVMDHRAHGRRIQCKSDYYVLRDDGYWWGVDQGGLLDFLVNLDLVKWHKNKMYLQVETGKWKPTNTFQVLLFGADSGLVKFGRTLETEDFSRIYRDAQNDSEFPHRTGWARDEYRQ